MEDVFAQNDCAKFMLILWQNRIAVTAVLT